jgi:predicted metalloprotease
MRQGWRRTLVAAAVGCVLLTGCSSTVVGSAAPGPGEPVDVSAEEFPIVDAQDGNDVDQLARNALTDLYTFWDAAYPDAYGDQLEHLSGPIFSVDPDNAGPDVFPDGLGCGGEVSDVEHNAYYCSDPGSSNNDSINYDRVFMEELATDYGRALVPFVMAHEFGHAIQARFGFEGESINQETQADCFAGAWSRWVVDGNAEHTSIRVPELDDVIRGYFLVRDEAGSDPNAGGAHGSYFDRLSAITEGYDDGVTACRDDFEEGRVFTAAAFSDNDLDNEGNSSYDEVLTLTEASLPEFWEPAFSDAFGTDFQSPTITSFEGSAPDCVQDDADLGYCADDNTVYYDEQDLTQPAYDDLGDFSVATAVALPYSLAIRDQAGLSTDDSAATASAACLTGVWTAQLFSENVSSARLQPGDVDEAVEFLLKYGVDPRVFPNTDLSGFELLRSFRSGFLEGGSSCDLGG